MMMESVNLCVLRFDVLHQGFQERGRRRVRRRFVGFVGAPVAVRCQLELPPSWVAKLSAVHAQRLQEQ